MLSHTHTHPSGLTPFCTLDQSMSYKHTNTLVNNSATLRNVLLHTNPHKRAFCVRHTSVLNVQVLGVSVRDTPVSV